jgi:hypothetical protein
MAVARQGKARLHSLWRTMGVDGMDEKAKRLADLGK